MRSCAYIGIAAVVAACSSRTVTERERALARIPADSLIIAAADGTALSTSTFKAAIDAARPHVPSSLGCVLDTASTSEAIAVGAHPDVGATIVIVTRAVVANCPALSKIDEHVWTATVGAGVLAESREKSMLVDARWERARPYLLREPFVIAAELPAYRVVAVAQPEPVDAWLAVDAIDAEATEKAIKAALTRYSTPQTVELGGKLAVTRTGTQVSVQAEALTSNDLAMIVVDTLRELDRPPAAPKSPFACLPPGRGIVSCHDNTKLKVSSVRDIVRSLGSVQATPVIAGADIVGIRLIGEPPMLLRRDDVILGLDAHRITDASQLLDLAEGLDGKAALAVRRSGVELVLDLSE